MPCRKSDAQDEELGLDALGLNEVREQPSAPLRVHSDVEAVAYRQVLSSDECARLVSALRRRTGWLEKSAKKHIRDSEGVALPEAFGRAFAALLGARLGITESGLPKRWRRRIVRKGCADVGTEGTWAPARINDVVRATRYRAGGHFAPHRDGTIVPRDGERSFLTVLLYLTDDFSGGETVFVRDSAELEYGAFDERKDVVARVRPEAGKALVFLQSELHAGTPVTAADLFDAEARKYILITEVFYERVEAPGRAARSRRASWELTGGGSEIPRRPDTSGAARGRGLGPGEHFAAARGPGPRGVGAFPGRDPLLLPAATDGPGVRQLCGGPVK